MSEAARPHLNRRRHQQALARQRRRRRKRRMARIRRIRLWRTVRGIRFWTRAGTTVLLLMAVAFWAKFAIVYDIPPYAQQGPLARVAAYVSVKPWWFGPPAFDLASYGIQSDADYMLHPYEVMLERLGRYAVIVTHPDFVWLARQAAP